MVPRFLAPNLANYALEIDGYLLRKQFSTDRFIKEKLIGKIQMKQSTKPNFNFKSRFMKFFYFFLIMCLFEFPTKNCPYSLTSSREFEK